MSWGERSCAHTFSNGGTDCPIPDECTIAYCNVNCRKYEWDGKTTPDSKKHEPVKPKPWDKVKKTSKRQTSRRKK